jgi:hypothetical protein
MEGAMMQLNAPATLAIAAALGVAMLACATLVAVEMPEPGNAVACTPPTRDIHNATADGKPMDCDQRLR